MSSTMLCRLPYELIRIIFEFAAAEDSYTTYNLILVSRESYAWLERKLYANIHLPSKISMDKFERSQAARNNNAFFASAVQQLHVTAPGPTLLSLCTNITHLALLPGHRWTDIPLHPMRHLQNLKYIALHTYNPVVLDCLPPSITHLQFRHYAEPPSKVIVRQVLEACPVLSHLMVDANAREFADNMRYILGILPSQCRSVVFALPRTTWLGVDALSAIRDMQEQFPQLLLVDTGGHDSGALENIMKCKQSSILRFEFWDAVDQFVGR